MEITHTSVPGVGTVHHCVTRSGQRFGIQVDRANRQSLLIYNPDNPDTPVQRIILDPDEADQVAEILHNRPVQDRLAALERRIAELTGQAP